MPDPVVETRICDFFDVFAAASQRLDREVLGGCFAEVFMSADPAGTHVVPREAFLDFLPRRAALFAAAGVASPALASISHTVLDDHYVLVDTTWTAERTAPGAGPVTLSSSFVVHLAADGPQIVFYLNHHDLAQLLRS